MAGGAARAMRRASRARQTAGRVAARRPAPRSSPHPHPPTCLPDPPDRGGGAWIGDSRPSAYPLPPGSAHLALKVNPSAARAPGLRQLVSSSGVRPASCAGRPLPSSSGSAPPERPAPSAFPAAVGAAAAPYVQPAAAASAVTQPRARLPGSRCHSAPSRRARQRAAPAAPPLPAPRRSVAAPSGKRSLLCGSARPSGICSPALWAQVCIRALGV